MKRYLTILEVSQKQAYIFASNKLRDNVINSAVIAYVISPGYLTKILEGSGFSEEKNVISSGGGNTVLEFSDEDKAKEAVRKITETVYREFDGLELFAKTIACEEAASLTESLKELKKALERKKSVRRAAFHQGTYGIEMICPKTLSVETKNKDSKEKEELQERELKQVAKQFCPKDFEVVNDFKKLGGEKNESNFISVVHIDGNGMGARVDSLYQEIEKEDWETAKAKLRRFSREIDNDFKAAFREMAEEIGESLKNGSLKGKLALESNNFPVRRVITAGDDICYVTEGRIGIESARIFIEKLTNKKNNVDKKGYSACAGVAIVHQKYPFYRAYELAEMLCSNAKKYGAGISPEDNGSSISSIDWHIEFGELKDSISKIRENYVTTDGNQLELRPYIIAAPRNIMDDKTYVARKYSSFKRSILTILADESKYGTGKVKGLRAALKKGETATKNYLSFYQMEQILIENRPRNEEISEEDIEQFFTGQAKKREAFIGQPDQKKHSTLFDAIEMMDTYLAIEKGGEAS